MRWALLSSVAVVFGTACGDNFHPPGSTSTPGTQWTDVVHVNNSCALRANGDLWCWGPHVGRLFGLSASAIIPSPTQVPGGWKQFDVEPQMACGIASDGTLTCWPGDAFPDPAPYTLPGSSWSSIAVGIGSLDASELSGPYACAIDSDAQLWCWGFDPYAQLGSANVPLSQTEPVQVAGRWLSVATGDSHTCAIRDNQTLWCWGRNDATQLGTAPDTTCTVTPDGVEACPTPRQVPGVWTSVAAGLDYTCAVAADTTLWCWGKNDLGQIGVPSAPAITGPVMLDGTGWTKASLSDGNSGYLVVHSCATRADGTLWCWGKNTLGELGIGTTSSSATPAQVAGSWREVTVGPTHTCALDDNGLPWCWGFNGDDALGEPMVADTLRQAPGSGWTMLGGDSCGLKVDGTLWCWGVLAGETITEQPGRWTTIDRQDAFTSPGSSAPLTATVGAVVPDVIGRASRDAWSCLLYSDHMLWCMGDDAVGQLGNMCLPQAEGAPPYCPDYQLSATDVTAVTGGDAYLCMILGADRHLQCNGHMSTPPPGGGWNTVRATPDDSVCALNDNGQVWCWGPTGNGYGSQNDRMPTQIPGSWAVLDEGCAIQTDGSLWYWGAVLVSPFAGVKNPQTGPIPPTKIATGHWTAVRNHDEPFEQSNGFGRSFCAIDDDGKLWCAGDGRAGGLARPPYETTPIPVVR